MKKAFQYIVAAVAILWTANPRADVATSQNYAITAETFSAGGGINGSGPYRHDITIAPVAAGRMVASPGLGLTVGYSSQLNNPPVAANDLRSHPAGSSVDFPFGFLLENDDDIDRDRIGILAVSAKSAAGGNVTLTPTLVSYTPPAGFGGADSFQYTIRDSNGDTATATVSLLIAPAATNQAINTIAFFRQSNGTLLLRFRQAPGFTDYIIEMTDELENLPLETVWETVYVAHPTADGIVEVVVSGRGGGNVYFRALVF